MAKPRAKIFNPNAPVKQTFSAGARRQVRNDYDDAVSSSSAVPSQNTSVNNSSNTNNVGQSSSATVGYEIDTFGSQFSLRFNAAYYLANKGKLLSDADKIAYELVSKIGTQHTTLSISLFLDGLHIDDQIKLQDRLIGIVKDVLLNELCGVQTLELHGWKISGTQQEMDQNRTTKDLIDQNNHILFNLGKALAKRGNTKKPLIFNLYDCQFTKKNIETFFNSIGLDKDDKPNTKTDLEKLVIPGNSIRDSFHQKEIRDMASSHGVELQLFVNKPTPVKPIAKAPVKDVNATENESDETESSAKKPENKKPYPWATLQNKNADVAIEIAPSKPSAKDYLIDVSLFGLLGVGAGITVGGSVALGFTFLKAAVLLTVLGIGITTMGVGFAIAGVILAACIIGGILYGKHAAEKNHELAMQQQQNQPEQKVEAEDDLDLVASLLDDEFSELAKRERPSSSSANIIMELEDSDQQPQKKPVTFGKYKGYSTTPSSSSSSSSPAPEVVERLDDSSSTLVVQEEHKDVGDLSFNHAHGVTLKKV